MNLKTKLAERFKAQYPNKRLLAVQLNGFSHTIFYDNGNRDSAIEILRFSGYANSIVDTGFENNDTLRPLFAGIPNYEYQHNATEIVYINPEDR